MSDFSIAGWSPVKAAEKLPSDIQKGAQAVSSVLGQGAADKNIPKAVDAITGSSGDSSKTGTAKATTKPADTLSTSGLKEGGNYTYKNGKLTEYTPAPAYGFDPLSMATIFNQSVAPELNTLNKQAQASTSADNAAVGADLKQDAALGIPASALGQLKTAYNNQTLADNANQYGQEKATIAGAPLDALVTQLGQSADAARLAGYEAEYGQSTSGSSSSSNIADQFSALLAAQADTNATSGG